MVKCFKCMGDGHVERDCPAEAKKKAVWAAETAVAAVYPAFIHNLVSEWVSE
jgi:hypothetical protein